MPIRLCILSIAYYLIFISCIILSLLKTIKFFVMSLAFADQLIKRQPKTSLSDSKFLFNDEV